MSAIGDLLNSLLPQRYARSGRPYGVALSRYDAHGLLGAALPPAETSSAASARRSRTRDRPELPGRTALRQELVDTGELVPVAVEGVRGKRLVLREEVELLAATPEPPVSVAFLPPFDPIVWDRPFLKSLFDFDYVWELFHPPAKRRWGWYVLPMLFRDRLVGRIERGSTARVAASR